MKQREYDNLVQKLAGEMIEDAAAEMHKSAAEGDEEEMDLENLPPEVVEQILAQQAEEEGEDDEEGKVACEVAYAAIQKAALTIKEAEAIEKAAEEAAAEAGAYKEAATLVFQHYGLLK